MKLFVLLCVLLYVTPVAANDLMRLPVPVIKDDMACVDTDGWRTIMLIANEYQGLHKWKLEIGSALERYADLQTLHEQQVLNFERMFKLYEAELDYQKTRVRELEKMKFSRSFERYFLWGVVVLETAVISALSIRQATQ
jgi:hypothetical protein